MLDKDEILVPKRVQELIRSSIRTLSNSMSNRSPDVHPRTGSNSLNPVEELPQELEQCWYTLEEKARENMQASATAQENGDISGQQNPFRIMHKNAKDKELQQYKKVSAFADVKRVTYTK